MCTGMSNAGRPAYYTVREAAWILGVKPATVSRAIRLGTLPAVWRHGRLVISAGALAQLLAKLSGTDPQTGKRTVTTSEIGGSSW
jgi:excisionase family DNA binding protein